MKASIEILKSKNDKLLYRYLQLQNKIKCLLIQDEKTEKSAAVMNISVGSMEDPKDRYGLAHLLEHMLFMGLVLY